MARITKIGIRNFRVFEKETTFNFAPLTVLTGPNNSGKSSLIKLLMLLSESFGIKNKLNNLNFIKGSQSLSGFSNVVSWDANNDSIKVILPFPLKYFDELFDIELNYKMTHKNSGELDSFKVFNNKRTLVEFYSNASLEQVAPSENAMKNIPETLKEELEGFDKNCFLKSVDFKYLEKTAFELKKIHKENEHKYKRTGFGLVLDNRIPTDPSQLKTEFQNDNSVFERFYVSQKDSVLHTLLDNKQLKSIEKSHFLFDLFFDGLPTKDNIDYQDDFERLYKRKLKRFGHYNIFSDDVHNRTTFEWFEETFRQGFLAEDVFENSKYTFNPSILGKIVFKDIFLDNILSTVNHLEESFEHIDYLSVNRGDQSRLYTEQGSMEFSKLLLQFDELNLSTKYKTKILSFLESSIKTFGIGTHLKIKRIEEVAYVIKVKQIGTGREILLSDLGFGYSQVIPILLKIVTLALKNSNDDPEDFGLIFAPSVFLLEEPESNLHPNLQSKLIEVLVDAASKFDIQFIIETHSEYIIRKLQYLTAKKKIKQEDSIIYYFHHTDNIPKGEKHIKEIRIREDGGLTDDFGPGFFDEATNIKFDLLRLRNSQSN